MHIYEKKKERTNSKEICFRFLPAPPALATFS